MDGFVLIETMDVARMIRAGDHVRCVSKTKPFSMVGMVLVSIESEEDMPLTTTYLNLLRLRDKRSFRIKAHNYHIYRKRHTPRGGARYSEVRVNLTESIESNNVISDIIRKYRRGDIREE